MLRVGEPVPEALAKAPLLAADGHPRPLGELVASRPTLVVFLRHFGCIGCAEQVHDILPRLGELDALGVGVLFVGSGPPEHVDAWALRNDLGDKPARVVTDPTLRAHRAAGLHRSFWATYGPRAVADFVRALSRGHRPRPTDGDLFQQGGAFLIADRRIVWAQTNRSLGDHADPSDAVEAALLVGGRRAAALV